MQSSRVTALPFLSGGRFLCRLYLGVHHLGNFVGLFNANETFGTPLIETETKRLPNTGFEKQRTCPTPAFKPTDPNGYISNVFIANRRITDSESAPSNEDSFVRTSIDQRYLHIFWTRPHPHILPILTNGCPPTSFGLFRSIGLRKFEPMRQG